MKRITLNRNGQISPNAREVSDLKAGQFQVGQHVMLRITGDCCYHSKEYAEYVVAKIEPCDRFGGGRETVTFERVGKAQTAATPAWVRRCRSSQSGGALACCAVAIISCIHYPAYIAEMGDGDYRFVSPAMTRVYGAPARDVIRRYLDCGAARVLDNEEGRIALATLNDNLARVHGADVRKGGAE